MLLKIQLSVEKCIDDFCILCNKKYESDDEVAERIKIGATSYKKFLLKFKGEIDKENVNFAKRNNAETAMIFLKKHICN